MSADAATGVEPATSGPAPGHPAPDPRASLHADDERYEAIGRRDRSLDGSFVYAVRTTGVYCRPSCGARLPLRANVSFFPGCEAAEEAGFRPCLRCRPRETARDAIAVRRACTFIEEAEETPSLAALAEAAGLSPHHFHRVFRRATGVTPKAYAEAARARRVAFRC